MFDLTNYLNTKQQAVNAALRALFLEIKPYPTPLVPAMHYSVEAGGKRLRPILCIAAAEAVGGSQQDVMPAACALELIHTYSLVHDDLPSMDNDDYRRGKPSCHRAFDVATAILAGDALLTAAFELLASTGQQQSNDQGKWLEVIYIIARAAGCEGMVQGQMMDLCSEGKSIIPEQLKTLHRLKTGALIEASLKVGALLGRGSAEEIAALEAYGRYIGLAFQLTDDILNIEGKPETLGKPVGSDKLKKKATSISVMGLEDARMHAVKVVDLAVKELRIFGKNGEALAAIARYVIERNR